LTALGRLAGDALRLPRQVTRQQRFIPTQAKSGQPLDIPLRIAASTLADFFHFSIYQLVSRVYIQET
jgi:hypothetical protein